MTQLKLYTLDKLSSTTFCCLCVCVSEWGIGVTRPNLQFFSTYRHKSHLLSHAQNTWSSFCFVFQGKKYILANSYAFCMSRFMMIFDKYQFGLHTITIGMFDQHSLFISLTDWLIDRCCVVSQECLFSTQLSPVSWKLVEKCGISRLSPFSPPLWIEIKIFVSCGLTI